MAYTSTLDANVTDPNVRAWVCLTASRMHLRASFMQILMGSTFANAPVGINGVKN